MTTRIEYLGLDQLLDICERLGLKVRDFGLLDSAAHRPRSGFGGVEAYEGIDQKAAALLHSIVRNHALLDGNKRLAWVAANVFLAVNRYESGLDPDEAYDFMVVVAADNTIDVAAIAAGLRVQPT